MTTSLYVIPLVPGPLLLTMFLLSQHNVRIKAWISNENNSVGDHINDQSTLVQVMVWWLHVH